MPRRTHAFASLAALLLAVGVAGCGGDASSSTDALERPPLTVGSDAAIPDASSSTPRTTTTATTPDDTSGGATADDTGGAADTTGTTDGTGDTGGDTATPQDTGGGTAPATGGGDGTDDTPEPAAPSNPGGAAPDYQQFCDENPGAC